MSTWSLEDEQRLLDMPIASFALVEVQKLLSGIKTLEDYADVWPEGRHVHWSGELRNRAKLQPRYAEIKPRLQRLQDKVLFIPYSVTRQLPDNERWVIENDINESRRR